MTPDPVTLREALDIHQGLLLAYGGTPGLRDPGGLASALAMPHQEVFGEVLFPDPVAQAAAYLYYVVTHPRPEGRGIEPNG